MKVYRHGDLLIVEVNKAPEGEYRKKEDLCLLEGEITGHHHRVDVGTAYIHVPGASPENDYLLGYLDLPKGGNLTHEEHHTIQLPPGIYKYYQQREYDEQEERAVID